MALLKTNVTTSPVIADTTNSSVVVNTRIENIQGNVNIVATQGIENTGAVAVPVNTFLKNISVDIEPTLDIKVTLNWANKAISELPLGRDITRYPIDFVSFIEAISKAVSKSFNETAIVSDTFSKTIDKSIFDSIESTESYSLNFNKGVSDSVQISESITIRLFLGRSAVDVVDISSSLIAYQQNYFAEDYIDFSQEYNTTGVIL